jgi:hypothetical protein
MICLSPAILASATTWREFNGESSEEYKLGRRSGNGYGVAWPQEAVQP